MKQAVNNHDIASLGSILGIWAHPDDETCTCAGVIAQAVANGQMVACITATKGGAGKTSDDQKWPQRKLGIIRQSEMAEALSIIGVHDLYWLDYEDGELDAANTKQAVAKLVKLIDRIKPDTILTFEPTGITGHQDHRTICAWTCAAVGQARCQPKVYGACETKERYENIGRSCQPLFNLYYNVEHPQTIAEKDGDLVFRLSKQQSKQKLEALMAHQSQTSQLFDSSLGKKYARHLCEVECFIKLETSNSTQ